MFLRHLLVLLLIFFGTFCTSPVSAQAQSEQANKPLLSLTFDEDVPGTAPKYWNKIWGNMGQDTMKVANIAPINEQSNYVVIQRESTSDSAKAPQWGAGIRIKDWTNPWLEVQFAFRHSGPLLDHVGQFELYGPHGERLYEIGLGARSSGGKGKVVFKCRSDPFQAISMSKVESDQWYRLVVRVPAPGTEATKSYCKLQSLNTQGQWVQLGDVAQGTVAKLKVPVLTVRLSLPPGELNARYQLAIDQIVAQESQVGPFEATP